MDIQLFGMPSEMVIEWVVSGRCDIGFVDPPYEHPSVVRQALPPVPAVAVVPVEHPLARHEALRPEDFARETFVSLAKSTQLRVSVDAFFAGKKVHRRLTQETPLSSVACSLVAFGAGLSIVDPFTANNFNHPSVTFRLLDPSISVQFNIVTHAATPLSGAAGDFIKGAHDEVIEFAKRRAEPLRKSRKLFG